MAYRLMDEMIVKYRMESKLREAEKERLIQAVKGPRKSRAWWLPVTVVLKSLLSAIVK